MLGAQLMPARADCIGGSDPEEIIRQLTAAPYSKLVRPGSEGPPTQVATQLYLESLNTVDEKGNAIDVSGYWRMSWTDPRLSFTSVEDGGCFDELHLPLEGSRSIPLTSPDAWVPDLYFASALSESYGSNFFAVYPDGSVYVSVRFKHSFKCVMDFVHMPFDTQTCTIEIMSYTEDASMVELAAKDGFGIVLPEAGASLPAWRVEKTDHRFDLLKYGTGENAMYWHSLKLDVTLERASGYYIMNDVLYGVLFVAMSWTGFFVSRTIAPARVAMCLLPVLTMLNHIRGVQSQLPRVSEMTWLSAFLLLSLIFNVVAVLEYGLVSYLLSREEGRAERLRVLRVLSSHLGRAYQQQRSRTLQLADEEGVEVELEEGQPPVKVSRSLSGLNLSNLLPMQQRMVHDAMKLFDDGDGIVHEVEMRRGLRQFNIYYTAEQVTEIFAMMGVMEGEGMRTSKFLKYLSDMREPSATLQKGFMDQPPSMQLEIVMRFGFMSSYLLVLAIMMPVAASM
jgi:hypothetical protein